MQPMPNIRGAVPNAMANTMGNAMSNAMPNAINPNNINMNMGKYGEFHVDILIFFCSFDIYASFKCI